VTSPAPYNPAAVSNSDHKRVKAKPVL